MLACCRSPCKQAQQATAALLHRTLGMSSKYFLVALTRMSENLLRSVVLMSRSASTRSHSCTHSRTAAAGSVSWSLVMRQNPCIDIGLRSLTEYDESLIEHCGEQQRGEDVRIHWIAWQA